MTLQPPRKGADILAIGFATTVAMWTLLYIAALPPGHFGVWFVVGILVAVLFAAGLLAGRFAGRGATGGAGLGLLLTGVSLLVLLSLAGGDESGLQRGAVWWILGFGVAAVALGALGAAIGRRRWSGQVANVNWTALLAWVTAITTLLMLVAGGIVTGLEAGLAVEGWWFPEGYFLPLFPVSLMQRDVCTFVEHAHRLWGLLVGLTTIVLAVHLWTVDRRRWLRWLAVIVVLAVIGQGVLGGSRVTEQNVAMGIAHGVFAQAIFAVLVAIAMVTSRAWVGDREPTARASAGTDRTLGVILLGVILLQIVAGTLFRHLQPLDDVPRGALMGLLHGHSFIGSVLVIVMVLFCGVRAWGMYAQQPIIKRLGMALVHTMILQVGLGIGSFVVVLMGAGDAEPGILEVALTTAHQATGAILLAGALCLLIWQRRLLVVIGPDDPGRS